MSLKQLIVACAAATTIALPGALFAQTTAAENAAVVTQEQAAKAADPTNEPTPGPAEQYKHMKVDEATAADAKYHANRTEPNRQARDKAEAEAGAAVQKANGMDQQVKP